MYGLPAQTRHNVYLSLRCFVRVSEKALKKPLTLILTLILILILIENAGFSPAFIYEAEGFVLK
jgi:hypothetical protein